MKLKRNIAFAIIAMLVMSIYCQGCSKSETVDNTPFPELVVTLNGDRWNYNDTIHIQVGEEFILDVSKSVVYGNLTIDTIGVYCERYPQQWTWVSGTSMIYHVDMTGIVPLRIVVRDSGNRNDTQWRYLKSY